MKIWFHKSNVLNNFRSTRQQQKQEKKFKKQQNRKSNKEREAESLELFSELRKSSRHISEQILKMLKKVNVDIKQFVEDKGFPEYTLLFPMPGAVRKLVLEMAKQYKVLPKIYGKGKNKSLILYRTNYTFLPSNWATIADSVVSKNNNILKGPIGKHQPSPSPKIAIPNSNKKERPGFVDTPPIGSIVGSSAEAIGESNPGHRMLLKMGWTPGESLGSSNSGITDPIAAKILKKRSGLGDK